MQVHYIGVIVAVLGVGDVSCSVFTSEEGPYNLIIYNTSTCVTEPPWFHTNVTAINGDGKSVLRGSISIQKEVKDVKFRIQVHYIDQGRVIKAFEIKNQNCQNTIIQIVLKALGLRYNSRRCAVKPTVTEFNNLNLDAVFHTVVQKLWYGSGEVRWEIFVSSITVMCLDIHVQIAKPKNVDNKEKS